MFRLSQSFAINMKLKTTILDSGRASPADPVLRGLGGPGEQLDPAVVAVLAHIAPVHLHGRQDGQLLQQVRSRASPRIIVLRPNPLARPVQRLLDNARESDT